jgi:hypothetical protein
MIVIFQSENWFSINAISNTSNFLNGSFWHLSGSFQISSIKLLKLFLLSSCLIWPVALKGMGRIDQRMFHVEWPLIVISVVRCVHLKRVSKNGLGSVLRISHNFRLSIFVKTVSVLHIQSVKIWHGFMGSVRWFDCYISWIRVMIWLIIQVSVLINTMFLRTFQVS